MVVLGSGHNFLPLAKFGCNRLPSVLPGSARRRGIFWWLDMSIAFICCICKGRVVCSWQWLSMATFCLSSTICCIRACPRHSYVERRVVEGRNNKMYTCQLFSSLSTYCFVDWGEGSSSKLTQHGSFVRLWTKDGHSVCTGTRRGKFRYMAETIGNLTCPLRSYPGNIVLRVLRW